VFRTGLAHAGLNLVVTAGYVGGFLWRRTSDLSTNVGWGPLALSVACLAALAVSGYLGDMLAYRYGVRVADEATQARAIATHGPRPSSARWPG
jgi:uncharacterized membrane protein